MLSWITITLNFIIINHFRITLNFINHEHLGDFYNCFPIVLPSTISILKSAFRHRDTVLLCDLWQPSPSISVIFAIQEVSHWFQMQVLRGRVCLCKCEVVLFSLRVAVQTCKIIINIIVRNNIYFWKDKHLLNPWLRSVAQSLYQISAFCTSDAKFLCLHKHLGHCKISLGFKITFWVMNITTEAWCSSKENCHDKIVPLTAFPKPFPCWLQFLSECYSAFIECVNLLHPAALRLAAAPSVLEALREAVAGM